MISRRRSPRSARGRPPRPDAHLLGHASVLALAGPADQPEPALRAAGDGHAMDGQAAPDLRRARARRHPVAGEGRGHRQRARRLHPALPGPVGVESLLGGSRHRPGVEPQQGVRGPADRRPARHRSRTGPTSSSSWRRSSRRRPSTRCARSGGTSGRTPTSAPSSCGCATASRPCPRSARIAALAQSLVAHLDQLDDRGYTLPRYRDWVLRQNKWRAGRHGLDTDLIIDAQGSLEPLRTCGGRAPRRAGPDGAQAGLHRRAGTGRTHPRRSELRAAAAGRARRRSSNPSDLKPVVDLLIVSSPPTRSADDRRGRPRRHRPHRRRARADLIALRRRLHRHPEPSWEEHRTTAALVDGWTGPACDAAARRPGTGVDLRHRRGGPVVAIRADIDALRMLDTKTVPYRSEVPGVCHACGHDVHTTAAVGAAIALAGHLRTTGEPGRVRLILQPGEESVPGGRERADRGRGDVGRRGDLRAALRPRPRRRVARRQRRRRSRPRPISCRSASRAPAATPRRPQHTADLVHIAARVVLDLHDGPQPAVRSA